MLKWKWTGQQVLNAVVIYYVTIVNQGRFTVQNVVDRVACWKYMGALVLLLQEMKCICLELTKHLLLLFTSITIVLQK